MLNQVVRIAVLSLSIGTLKVQNKMVLLYDLIRLTLLYLLSGDVPSADSLLERLNERRRL